MAIPREAQAERAALIRYLRSQVADPPFDDLDARVKVLLEQIVRDVVAGKHVKAVRRG